MTGAGIYEGDIALCQKAETAEPGQLVVALVNGDEATVKFLVREDDTWKLRPANPDYPDIAIEEDHDRIQGVVISIQSAHPGRRPWCRASWVRRSERRCAKVSPPKRGRMQSRAS